MSWVKNIETKKKLVIVNFGGPRTLEEVPSFLKSLLTDEDLIRTPFPPFFQRKFFERIAKKRAPVVARDYAKIGGGSPIYEDTNWFAGKLESELNIPTWAFHRYLDATHPAFIESLSESLAQEVLVFPLFPQFCYATTGSIARWFSRHLNPDLVRSMKWISSYATHEAYIQAFSSCIREFLQEKRMREEDVFLLFSAHGVPLKFIKEGDVYQKECEASFSAIARNFPKAESFLSYQSKFGKQRWLEPSTVDICIHPNKVIKDKKEVVFIPLSFSSDHIETLYEIEEYVSLLQFQGFSAHRCPALGRRADWIAAAQAILATGSFVANQDLIRPRLNFFG